MTHSATAAPRSRRMSVPQALAGSAAVAVALALPLAGALAPPQPARHAEAGAQGQVVTLSGRIENRGSESDAFYLHSAAGLAFRLQLDPLAPAPPLLAACRPHAPACRASVTGRADGDALHVTAIRDLEAGSLR